MPRLRGRIVPSSSYTAHGRRRRHRSDHTERGSRRPATRPSGKDCKDYNADRLPGVFALGAGGWLPAPPGRPDPGLPMVDGLVMDVSSWPGAGDLDVRLAWRTIMRLTGKIGIVT